jgi:putative membrane protein
MVSLLIRWALNAAALLVVAYTVSGVRVTGVGAAFVAAAVIGLVNATLGNIVMFVAWPVRVLTLGLASLVINALMLMLSAALVPGFYVDGFLAALLGSILLSIVAAAFRWFFLGSPESMEKKP